MTIGRHDWHRLASFSWRGSSSSGIVTLLLIAYQQRIRCEADDDRLGLGKIHDLEPLVTDHGDPCPQEDDIVHLDRKDEILLDSVNHEKPFRWR